MEVMQVQFIEDGECFGGIMVNHEFIICGCCGGVLEVAEIGEENIFPLSWVNISDEIQGDD